MKYVDEFRDKVLAKIWPNKFLKRLIQAANIT